MIFTAFVTAASLMFGEVGLRVREFIAELCRCDEFTPIARRPVHFRFREPPAEKLLPGLQGVGSSASSLPRIRRRPNPRRAPQATGAQQGTRKRP